MIKALFASVALMIPALALADANCVANPKSEWKTESDARAKFEKEGYKINVFKVSGNCYEIYGKDKNGQKAEVYFHPVDGSVVKAKQG